MTHKHLFGPVLSRRLGVSLGVDMVPPKTCTLDCAYCECGRTTTLTSERRPYVPASEIIPELDDYLKEHPKLDYITFGGSGEPTLNSEIGKVLSFVKEQYSGYRTALLTNATLFHLPEVRQTCLNFDLVLPSLDAVSQEAFEHVNRSHQDLDSARYVEGLVAFAREFRGLLWLEVFILPGINDSDEELEALKHAIERIGPTRVQINSLDRPAPFDWVTPANAERLAQIADYMLPLPVEVISRKTIDYVARPSNPQAVETVLSTCRRRPCTVEDLAGLTGMHINAMYKLLGRLLDKNKLVAEHVAGQVFYRALEETETGT